MMFSLMQRVIKTREGKTYTSQPSDFQDHGGVVIYSGFLNLVKHHIHSEQITEDYLTFSCFGFLSAITILLVLSAGIFIISTDENFSSTIHPEELRYKLNVPQNQGQS